MPDDVASPGAWLWVIRTDTGQILSQGRQWTRLDDPAMVVAKERIVAWAYPRIKDGRLDELPGVTCHVQRAGDPEVKARADTRIRLRRAAARIITAR